MTAFTLRTVKGSALTWAELDANFTALEASKFDVASLAANVGTFLGTPSSANLLAAMTTKTGTGNLVFGTSPTIATPSITGRSVLQGLATAIAAKSANYTATTSDHTLYFDTTAAGYTLTLPAASGNAGLEYVVKKTVAANTLTIDANASETIDGALTLTLSSQYDTVQIKCDGANWQVMARGATVPGGSGTVTSVAAITLGTTGTDLSSTVANGTTTPVITLNVPTASATNRGALSAADWSTFNGKQAALSLAAGVQTFLGAPSSANLATALTDKTGTGVNVFGTSPTIATPSITGRAVLQGLATAIAPKTANYTATTSDHTLYFDTTAAGYTLTLPAASGNAGLEYVVKKTVAANTLIIDANASETIDGATTLTLTAQYDTVQIKCDGTNWQVMARGATVGGGSGTVTSVAAITLGTTGTDLSSTVANGTTTPVITLNVPTASATNRGALSAADWSTFNGKQAALSLAAGVQTFLGAPSSANLATALTDKTGTGVNVFGTSPTIATPSITGRAVLQGVATAIAPKTANYTATTSDHTLYFDTTAAGYTLTLPAASGNSGLEYIVKKTVAANTLTIDANASETIDGALTLVLSSQYDATHIKCDGTNWQVLGRGATVPAGSGTVTSVAALTLGTTGTDLSSTVANGTTTPVITLNVPTASATNRGVLSSADWSTFNGKQAALTLATGVQTFLGSPSSANLLAAMTDETGTGLLVFNASPSFTGKALLQGVATAFSSSAKTANYTATTSDNTIHFDTTAAGYTLTLPAASGNAGLEYSVKKLVAANTLTIDANASETIDGALTLVLSSQYDAVQIKCDGSNWHVLARGATVGGGSGTVTSVSAITLGTTGTDLSSTVANATTTPVITLNVPTASATNRGALSAADWSTFNGKQAALSLAAGVQTFLGTPSSANLLAAMTDETGTGLLVFGTSPTIATPTITGKATLAGLVGAASTKTANYTLTTSDHYILADATSGNLTLTLPAASGNAGLQYHITKTTAANQVIIDPNASETINGSSTFTIYATHDGLIIECDGVGWRIVAANIANPNYSIIGCSTYILGGHIYAGGGARIGWSSTGYLGNNSDGDFNLTNNAGNVGRLRVGGVSSDVVTKTAAYTTTTFDETILCDTTTAFTLTLHTAVGNKGQRIEVVKTVTANTLTIATTSSQTINGAAASAQNLTTQWSRFTVKSDGSNWVRVG